MIKRRLEDRKNVSLEEALSSLGHLRRVTTSVTRWPNCFFQYLAIYNYEILPKIMQIVSNWVPNLAKYQINLKYNAKVFLTFAKLAKISQIWSHCSPHQNSHKKIDCFSAKF